MGSLAAEPATTAISPGRASSRYRNRMDLRFTGELWYWRGPSPFHFVTVPESQSGELSAIAPLVSYGWGMVPVTLRVGATESPTALWPKDGGYIVPLKSALREAEGIELGDLVEIELRVGERML